MKVYDRDCSIDILEYFEMLFLSDDWVLHSIPRSGSDWILIEFQHNAKVSDRYFGLYQKQISHNVCQYLGVDIGPEVVYQITQSRNLSDFRSEFKHV